jgi:hypothetical protein
MVKGHTPRVLERSSLEWKKFWLLLWTSLSFVALFQRIDSSVPDRLGTYG